MTKRAIRHSLLAIITLLAFAPFQTLQANAQGNSSTVKVEELRLPGAGKVQLDATLYLPKKLPAPAIMLAHGFTGYKASVAGQAKQLQDAGYVVMAWTARGFGKSTGEISMNSPEGEVADARKLIDYLSTRKEVIQQKAGDPLVGIARASYGGALSLLTAG